MPDVLDSHSIFENAVEDFEGIANERHHVYAGPLFDLRRAQRVPTDSVNDRADAQFKRLRYPVAKGTTTISRNFAKIGDGAVRVLNPHARRKVRNAASTSFSVATPLRSASSIA